MSGEGRIVHHHHESNQGSYDVPPPSAPAAPAGAYEEPPPPPPVVPHYGTFQGVPSSPSVGSPPGDMDPPSYYHHSPGYQSVPGYIFADKMSVRDHDRLNDRLPCCGIGLGWFLFIIGFFLAGIPWYAAAIILICGRHVDPREKRAYVCCTFFSVLAIIVTINFWRHET